MIEIISVIIILGILTTFASLSVTKYITKSKAATYESYKHDLSGAANNLMIDCFNNNAENCIIPLTGEKVKVTYDQLLNGKYSENIKDPEGDGFCSDSFVIASNTTDNLSDIKYQVCLYCSKYKSTEGDCQEALNWDSNYQPCTGENCFPTDPTNPDPSNPTPEDPDPVDPDPDRPDPDNPDPETPDPEEPDKPVNPDSDDNISPTCGTVIGESTTWTNGSRTITVGCSDSGSGCKQTQFTKTFTAEEGKIIQKGTITIEDNAGNKKSCPVNVFIDKAKPTCSFAIRSASADYNGWYGSNTSAILSKSDEGSGISKYAIYSTSSSYESRVKETDYVYGSTSLDLKESGKKVILGKVIDAAGNTNTCRREVKIDLDPPTLSITNPTNGNWTNKDVQLTLNGNDRDGSGIKYYAYSYSTSSNKTYYQYTNSSTSSYKPSLIKDEQKRNIYIKVCDYLNNCSTGSTLLQIDKTPPYTPYLSIDYIYDSYNTNNGTLGKTVFDIYCVLENGTVVYPKKKGGAGETALKNKQESITCYTFKIWDGLGTASSNKTFYDDNLSGVQEPSLHRFGSGTSDAVGIHNWDYRETASTHRSTTLGSSTCSIYNGGIFQTYAVDRAGNRSKNVLTVYSVSGTQEDVISNGKPNDKAKTCMLNSYYYFSPKEGCTGKNCPSYNLK